MSVTDVRFWPRGKFVFSPNKHSRSYLRSSTIGQALYSGTRKAENKNAVKKTKFY